MQQGNIVNNVLEIFMLYGFAAKHQHEGFMAMRIDIRCRMAKPMHIGLCCAV